MKLVEMMKSFWKEEEGLTMVEYALVGAAIAAVAVVAFNTLGTNVTSKANELSSALS